MDEIVSFMTDYHDQMALLGAVLFLVSTVGFMLHKVKKVPGEEPKMNKAEYILTKRQQRKIETSLIADGVEDLLLKLFAEGKISEERYQAWHLRFGKQLGLRDLLPIPKPLTVAQRKQASIARLKNGVYKPTQIPKEKKVYKPKNIVDSILNGV